MDPYLLVALGLLHLVAIADVWTSQLSRVAKLLWTLTLLFLWGVGIAAWALTRHTAHRPLPPIPAEE
jgi:hypothetical protein